ncbi:MAG TPA: hypothetical protein VNB64_12305 [Solirubrobacteraceae bacterium]|nr:hypothetical protein [Solirubrobacteraceae bacterium]
MAIDLPKPENECFFITPIGEDGSEIRERADGVLSAVVKPAAEQVGLSTVRADHIAEPGQIPTQVIDHVLTAKGAVADLTGANPNVYWELAVRHTAQLPVVLIASESEKGKMPADLFSMRTIFFDETSLKSSSAARDDVAKHLSNAVTGGKVDSPVSTSINLMKLAEGTDVEQTLATILGSIESLQRDVRLVGMQAERALTLAQQEGPSEHVGVHPGAIAALMDAYTELKRLAKERDDQELNAHLGALFQPASYLDMQRRDAVDTPAAEELRRAERMRTLRRLRERRAALAEAQEEKQEQDEGNVAEHVEPEGEEV